MFNPIKGTCTYCGAQDVYICSTPESDEKCKDCHELTISNCKKALKALKSVNVAPTKSKPKQLSDWDEEMNSAIKELTKDSLLVIDGILVGDNNGNQKVD